MAVEDLSDYIGETGVTPYDLMWARRDVLEYHREYGMPVIIKRTYNSDHAAVAEGPHGEEVRRDNTYDDAYGQGFFNPQSIISMQGRWGYSQGWFTYVTFADSPLEVDPGQRGARKAIRHVSEMPFAPLLWEGDLIITLEIERLDTQQIRILATGDRYITEAVTPITMRGEFTRIYVPRQEAETTFYQDSQRFIAQQFQAVRMPRYHHVYDIPVL
jgi:hypothetical protein